MHQVEKSEGPPPAVVRSRLVIEIASELIARDDWSKRQARVQFRSHASPDWSLTLFASDAPSVIEQVARREVDLAIVNPAGPLTLAVRGNGPFAQPLPLRAISVIPSTDQFVFTVAPGTGLKSLQDVRERRYPLRVSLRKQQDHSNSLLLPIVLEKAGFSLDDLESWGGQVRYDAGLPSGPDRLGALERGEIDAIFDAATGSWANQAVHAGVQFLALGETLLADLEALGWRRGFLSRQEFPALPHNLEGRSIDFSGWPIFTRADLPDNLVTAFCEALEARKDRVPWEQVGPLPLDRMVQNASDTPLDVPLHPAAERYWRARGYLT
jgi:TRAP-type uncharacterized transport system substrate-binding protein